MAKKPYMYLCDEFERALKSFPSVDRNLDYKIHKVVADCAVDFGSKAFKEYMNKRNCVTQSNGSLVINADKGVLWGEILVPICATKKERRGGIYSKGLPITPDVDLCGSKACEIEQVHFHNGKCPTSHVHIYCDLKKVEAKRHCIRKIVNFLGDKLGEYAEATCRD